MVDYEFGELKIPRLKEVKKEEQDPPASSRHGPPDMAAMNAERETKMRRFRFLFLLSLKLFKTSVVDPYLVGSVSFGRIRIRIVKWENGPGTDPGSKKKHKKGKNITKKCRHTYFIYIIENNSRENLQGKIRFTETVSRDRIRIRFSPIRIQIKIIWIHNTV